jgi:hypothetical protein
MSSDEQVSAMVATLAGVDAAPRGASQWVRRLYPNSKAGELAGTDGRKRDFPEVARAPVDRCHNP